VSQDLEKALREALRRVDPAEDFAERVLARAESERRRRESRSRWLPLALAASALIAAVIAYTWRTYEERQQGLEARQQLIKALQVTGEKLDLAYRAVNDESRASIADDEGA
jgi:hypothetical protein